MTGWESDHGPAPLEVRPVDPERSDTGPATPNSNETLARHGLSQSRSGFREDRPDHAAALSALRRAFE